MAGNRFEIQVHALDRFSKTFRDLNNQASKATRPLVNVHRQVGSLAREMHLDKVAKGMGKVSDAAVNVSRTLGLSLGPLEAVFGASGIIGGIAAAGGAAVALGVNFARTGFEVSRASRAMGVSTQDLQQLRGAMKLMGIDASVADETLGSLGHTLQDARFGRDPAALQVLRHLGIGIPMKNGIVDQVAALEGITRALAKISDPQLRRVLADALHIPQEALPALIEGAENLDRLKRKAQDLGVVFSNDGIKKSTEFATSLNLLKVAAEGAADSFGEKLAPSMVTVMDTLTKRLFQSKSSPGSALMGLGLDQYRWLLRFSHVGSLFDNAGTAYGQREDRRPDAAGGGQRWRFGGGSRRQAQQPWKPALMARGAVGRWLRDLRQLDGRPPSHGAAAGAIRRPRRQHPSIGDRQVRASQRERHRRLPG